VLTLALNSVMTNLVVVFFLVICVAMILIVLIQRAQGGGLSGAFGAGGGGAGAGQTAFGTKTGDVLTWGTVTIFFIYLVTAIGLNFVARPSTAGAPQSPVLVSPEQAGDPELEQPAPMPDAEGEPPRGVDVLEEAVNPPGESPLNPEPEPFGAPDEPAADPVDPATAETPSDPR
jgi:preprotein translocase subunit SecG